MSNTTIPSNFDLTQKQNSANLLNNGQLGSKEKSTKSKSAKIKNTGPSNLDWGLLIGVNSSGSFTSQQQNANFYGSSPIDAYLGLFATWHISNRWAMSPQIKLFSPQLITDTYTHANGSKVDSGQVLKITDSRKTYSASIPLYVVYKTNGNLSFMAGPVINIPVKQTNTTSTLLPDGIKADTAYYKKTIAVLNKTQYDQKLNFGFSAGLNYLLNRFTLEVNWLQSISGYQTTSDFGTHKSYDGTFQFVVKFQLNKPKR